MKKILIALVAMGIVAAHANVININLTLDGVDRGGVLYVDTVMNGTAYTGVELPASYTGTTWNDFDGTTGTNALLDTDGAGGYSLMAPNGYAKWGNSGTFTGGGALAGYGYNLGGQVWTITGLGTSPEWNVYVYGEDANPATGMYTVGGVQKSNVTTATPPGAWTEGANYSVWTNVAPVAGNIAITMDSGMLGGIQLVAVPEPATIGLLGIFGGAMVFIRRKLMIR